MFGESLLSVRYWNILNWQRHHLAFLLKSNKQESQFQSFLEAKLHLILGCHNLIWSVGEVQNCKLWDSSEKVQFIRVCRILSAICISIALFRQRIQSRNEQSNTPTLTALPSYDMMEQIIEDIENEHFVMPSVKWSKHRKCFHFRYFLKVEKTQSCI